jgi:uncharacterized protein (DUF983 family)
VTVSFQQRSTWSGLKRGILGRCPQCGEGRLFSSYLKVVPACAVCAHSLAQYRSDDGPAYFTILIVGHVVLAPFLMSSIILTWPMEWLFALLLPGIVGLTLALLPRVKGAFVGVQWAVGDRVGV